MTRAGMTALGVAFPPTIRTNAFWREHHPDLVASASERALSKLWAEPEAQSKFARAMAPYASDPFKGASERRVLVGDEGALELEAAAVGHVMAAWDGDASQVDLLIVAAMRPDSIAVGDAAWLAKRLGLACPAINLETACSSSVMALELACALVDTQRYQRVLVVASCTYSRDIDPDDTLAWFLADGAGAFMVESRERNATPLGAHSISTAETCGAFVHELKVEDGLPRAKMRATRAAGEVLHDTAEPYLRQCCTGALRAAGLTTDDIALFVFNTPTAWYADFGADVLGVDRDRTVSTYPIYTNIGPALMPANLHHAALHGRLAPDDVALLYAVGSASTAIATVIRWGEVALGAAPAPPQTPTPRVATSTE